MFERPCQVLPIVLYRLKQKLEEWKACQREWDKVWREQMQRAYWRSLDHQAIATRSTDKKLFIAKNIQADLQAKLEESQTMRKGGLKPPKYQMEMKFQDLDVLLDTAHLLCLFFDRSSNAFGADPSRLINFVKDFIPVFFGLDREAFLDYMDELMLNATPADELEDQYGADDTSMASRKVVNTQKLDLLRETLERKTSEEQRPGSGRWCCP
jgi:paired amphipathic helix protein Sin3a